MCSGSKPGEEGEEKEEEKEERCARGCKSHYSDRQPTNSSTPTRLRENYRQEGGIRRLGGAVHSSSLEYLYDKSVHCSLLSLV